jgi:hypothetical protein
MSTGTEPRSGSGGGGGGGDRACYNCGATGHISRECPEPDKRQRAGGGGSRGGGGGGGGYSNRGRDHGRGESPGHRQGGRSRSRSRSRDRDSGHSRGRRDRQPGSTNDTTGRDRSGAKEPTEEEEARPKSEAERAAERAEERRRMEELEDLDAEKDLKFDLSGGKKTLFAPVETMTDLPRQARDKRTEFSPKGDISRRFRWRAIVQEDRSGGGCGESKR